MSVRILAIILGLVSLSVARNAPGGLSLPLSYYASGTISLPYYEIQEPFTAYFNGKSMKSRIDYYEGMVKSFQRGDINMGFAFSYMTTEKVYNQMTCFKVAGAAVQSVFPDTTPFQQVDSVVFNNKPCTMWKNVVTNYTRTSTYTLWVNKVTNLPVRYEMMGYDSLIGSHYDKYYVDYDNVIPGAPEDTFFEVPNNNTCQGYPGPGMEHTLRYNPFNELVSHKKDHHAKAFGEFKNKFDRKYSSDKDHVTRGDTFTQNLRFIHSHNRAGLSYKLAVNHLADKTQAELRTMNGYRNTLNEPNGALPFDKNMMNPGDLPQQVDWRLRGGVSQVKDQGICGSCWSFGTAETIEGAYFVKTGELIRLSQQELMDCSWGFGNNACDGGEDFRAYQWMMKNGGIAAEKDYGPYLMADGMCRSKNVSATVSIKGFVNVTSGDATALQMAIYKKGPISVGIDASHPSLSFYQHGVYYEPKCGNTPDDLDHAVLAVGYGVMDGHKYWLIKNSWSTYWGNDGYVLMSQENNNCGVATDATYVIV